MSPRFLMRTKVPLLLALAAAAATSVPQTANAGLMAVSLVIPVYTPSCPAYLDFVEGAAGTGVSGAAYVFVMDTVSVAFTYNTPAHEFIVSPIVLPVETDPSAVEHTESETTIETGAYLVAATHQWMSIAGIPTTQYTNDYKYLPANP